MKKFNVSFDVREDKLTLIIGLLSNEVGALNITEVGKATGMRTHISSPRKSRPAGTPPLPDVALAFLKEHKGKNVTDKQVGEALAKAGYASTSNSPALSALVKQKKVKLVSRGVYTLA